jgi:hypothetical protein
LKVESGRTEESEDFGSEELDENIDIDSTVIDTIDLN